MTAPKMQKDVSVTVPSDEPMITPALARALFKIIRRAAVANRGESSSTRSE